ncbi:MAG: diacylglycerol kinase family protein [Flavobacteriaceae bacterium]|nr:diacylglycerol kinase family protein [Flavobacteriaceae bacterium]
MKPDDGFILGRLKSAIYAAKGLWILIFTEHSFMFHGSLSVLLIVLGFYNDLTPTEWGFQILAVGLIMVAEAVNTAIEKLANHIEPDFHKTIGIIKDVGAGAVLLALFVEIAIVALIYVPKYW